LEFARIDIEIDNNILKNINLIIFDKDGTLFRLFPFWSEVALKRAKFICKYKDADIYVNRREFLKN
jgi:hypothetical protein